MYKKAEYKINKMIKDYVCYVHHIVLDSIKPEDKNFH